MSGRENVRGDMFKGMTGSRRFKGTDPGVTFLRNTDNSSNIISRLSNSEIIKLADSVTFTTSSSHSHFSSVT